MWSRAATGPQQPQSRAAGTDHRSRGSTDGGLGNGRHRKRRGSTEYQPPNSPPRGSAPPGGHPGPPGGPPNGPGRPPGGPPYDSGDDDEQSDEDTSDAGGPRTGRCYSGKGQLGPAGSDMSMLTEILAQLSNSAAQENELMRQLVLHSANEVDDEEEAHEGHSSGTAKGEQAGSKKKFPKQNKAILEMLRSSLSHGQHSDEYPPFGANLTGVDLSTLSSQTWQSDSSTAMSLTSWQGPLSMLSSVPNAQSTWTIPKAGMNVGRE